MGDAKWWGAQCGTLITSRWMDYRNSLPVSLKTSKTRASNSDSNHNLQQTLIMAHLETFRWVNSSVSWSPTHLFARTKLTSEIRWLPYRKTKKNNLNKCSYALELKCRVTLQDWQPAASSKSFILHKWVKSALNKFVSSLQEPPPPPALTKSSVQTSLNQVY